MSTDPNGNGGAPPEQTPARRSRANPVLKQMLKDRLNELMLARGWRQIDLVEATGLPRDAISTYVLGKVLPGNLALNKIAEAFGVRPDDLVPGATSSQTVAPSRKVATENVPGLPGYTHLRIDQVVRSSSALKILTILEEEHVAYANRGREPAKV